MSDDTDQLTLREAELDLAEARVNDLHTRFRTTGLDEKTTLDGWLDYHRAVLLWKCAGLTDEQARTAAAPPSTLHLLGLLRHMADNEVWWFRERLAGERVPGEDHFAHEHDTDPDRDLNAPPDATLAEARARFDSACAQSRAIVAALPSLDAEGTNRRGEPMSARWIMTHMLEEYARHNGHADLLRERIDGQTG